MLNSTSVKTRFLASVFANIIRSIIGFVSGLLVARGLGPSSYGDLSFLLGSFVAISALLGMGTQNAFYTFLSRRTRGFLFYLVYFIWIIFQFLITLIFVAFLMPESLFQKIWLGHSHEIVLIALIVVFLQQQVWQTVTQIGESLRKTVKLQLLNIAISLTYMVVIVLMTIFSVMSLKNIMLIMIAQSVIATFVAYQVLGGSKIACSEESTSANQIIEEYFGYCKPLVVLSLTVFLYNFADKWMLQNYGGAIQQGYFQIANQFATISLLATTSILNIFWKEIAHAWENKDVERVERLYRKVSRGLLMVGAITSGLLMPWAKEIVIITLGIEYAPAWPVLALMLLYPIYQSMGQICGSMFLARGQTKVHMYFTLGSTLLSLPITYLLLAPIEDYGLNMGAWGIAAKMLLLCAIGANIESWFISRYGGWKFDWVYQAVGIPLMILLGYFMKVVIGFFWNLKSISFLSLFVPVTFASLLYLTAVIWVIALLPWLVGMDSNEIKFIRKLLTVRIKQLLKGSVAI